MSLSARCQTERAADSGKYQVISLSKLFSPSNVTLNIRRLLNSCIYGEAWPSTCCSDTLVRANSDSLQQEKANRLVTVSPKHQHHVIEHESVSATCCVTFESQTTFTCLLCCISSVFIVCFCCDGVFLLRMSCL